MITEFPQVYDLSAVYGMLKTMGDRLFPSVPYKVLSVRDEDLDDVHKEIPQDDKTWSLETAVTGYVNPRPDTEPMTRFGIEEKRDIVMEASIPHLVEAGLVEQDPDTWEVTEKVGPGDWFYFSGYWHEVTVIHRGRMWANTDIPLYLEFTGNRVRPESREYQGI